MLSQFFCFFNLRFPFLIYEQKKNYSKFWAIIFNHIIFKAIEVITSCFFLCIKMAVKYYKKTPTRNRWDISKYFWRRKRKKAKKGPRKISKFYWRRTRKKHQYYCEHNKNLSEGQKLKLFCRFFRDPRTIKFFISWISRWNLKQF